ncbi:unnamed protein product [Cuscuta campestris]|uniref:BHLH domain-containing protein n=1 Tax=Cuscuta campestris TaxID=132261 RepID=A0A484KY25_9ASTE|nr:unnamed protein product [Cuscuta campestris]
MENGYFLNGGAPAPFPCTASSWKTSPESQLNRPWDDSLYHYTQFDSSPAASAFAIRELIGDLGNICTPSPPPLAAAAGSYSGNSEVTINASCYTAPLNSFPLNTPNPHALLADPGFAERAARFSNFGSRSFNGRKSQLALNGNSKFPYRSTAISRVSSSPALEFPLQNQKSGAPANSNEASSVSEQVASGSISQGDMNLRKRKSAARGRSMEDTTNGGKGFETDHNSSPKRSKLTDDVTEDYNSEKQSKANQKPPEAPKDYIHVRARRGQATDSHSLAERVRREKISERMKLLQDLVPGCNKVTGKALMLDEIINYVQSLQRQVEFLSMKLASVNPSLDFSNDKNMPMDICHPLDSPSSSSLPPNFHILHHHMQPPQQHNNVSTVGPLESSPCHVMGMQLPLLDGFGEAPSQFPSTCDGELQSVVQMGLNQTSPPERIC